MFTDDDLCVDPAPPLSERIEFVVEADAHDVVGLALESALLGVRVAATVEKKPVLLPMTVVVVDASGVAESSKL